MLHPRQRHHDARPHSRFASAPRPPGRILRPVRQLESDQHGGLRRLPNIVPQSGVHLERTLEEYRSGIFSKRARRAPLALRQLRGLSHAAAAGARCDRAAKRRLRSVLSTCGPASTWRSPFPHRDAMRQRGGRYAKLRLRRASPCSQARGSPPDLFSFQIETLAGHNEPSGAAQDRRMWLEFTAYDKSGRRLEAVGTAAATSRTARSRKSRRRPEARPEPARVP